MRSVGVSCVGLLAVEVASFMMLKPPLLRNTWPRTCYGGAQVTTTGLTVQAPESCNRHLRTSGVIM